MDRQPAMGEPAYTSLATFRAAYRQTLQQLQERIAADANVLGVPYAEELPRTYHGWHQIEVDVGAVAIEDPRGHRAARAPVLRGRGFTLADLESDARVVNRRSAVRRSSPRRRRPHRASHPLPRRREPSKQIVAGIALGVLLTLGLRSLAFDDAASTLLIVAAYGLLMLAVCAAACIVPTRRALSIEPTDALRAEG